MYHIDHVGIVVQNLYLDAFKFRDETGLDSYDAGVFPMGVAQRAVPTGNDTYIEIEAVIDQRRAEQHFFGVWFLDIIESGEDRYLGWVIRVDSLEELEAVAEQLGSTVGEEWGRVRPDGRRHKTRVTPGLTDHMWPKGLPIFQYWTDMSEHPDRVNLASRAEHRGVKPAGFAWVEVGAEEETRQWLGSIADALPIRFVEGPPGLYGVGVATEDGGEIAIRRKPVDVSLASSYRPPADYSVGPVESW